MSVYRETGAHVYGTVIGLRNLRHTTLPIKDIRQIQPTNKKAGADNLCQHRLL